MKVSFSKHCEILHVNAKVKNNGLNVVVTQSILKFHSLKNVNVGSRESFAKMSSTLPFVVNLVNTAFGVTVLAVPYCFHQVSKF